ncbi:CDP-glycerol glycerophosphotransferase family protein [Candidatus Kaiserbacteria bacterium]|nr:CDP-glycerol glycerophosphotransferase family protein [Candidatus Kaiserbacteria bacterium]
MKTVFIVISKDIIRRNILDTDFWPEFIKANSGSNIVLIVEEGSENYYTKNFSAPNVTVRGIKRVVPTFFGSIVLFMVRTGIRSRSTTTYRRRAYARGSAGLLQTVFKTLISVTIARLNIYKHFVRFLVLLMSTPKAVNDLFDEFKPNLVFAFSMIDNDFDIPIMIEAKRRKVRIVGMVRSWDNLNNHGLLAVLPDRILLQNIWLVEIAKKLQAFDPEDLGVILVGLPHYDTYKNPDMYIKPREEFFNSIGLDPKKKLILLGGSDFYYSEDELPKILDKAIESGEIKSTQVIFRPHPRSIFSIEDYHLQGLKNIKLDEGAKAFSDTEYFINLMVHSDVIINIASTLSIDASVFDTPVICINFDTPDKKLSHFESVHRLYDHFDHYEKLVSSGGVRTPTSPQKLIKDINEYLANPKLDKEGRRKIVEFFVEPFDGKSGERLSKILTNEVDKVG